MTGRLPISIVRLLILAALGAVAAGCAGSTGSPWSGAEFVAGDERTVSYRVGGWSSADSAAQAHCGQHGRTAKQIGRQVLNAASQLQIVYYDCLPTGPAQAPAR